VIVEISQFFNFSRWQPYAILDVFTAFLDHIRSIFGGLYWCAKFGCNETLNVLCVWLENACLRPQNYGFEGFDPVNGAVYQHNPQSHILA